MSEIDKVIASKKRQPPSARAQREGCFRDGVSKIDYVLVVDRAVAKIPEKNAKVLIFINFLRLQGLQFELDKGKIPEHIYLKVHLPRKALTRYAVMYDKDIHNKGHNKITNEAPGLSKCYLNHLTRIGWDDFVRQNGEITSAERIYIAHQVLTVSDFPNGLGLKQLLAQKLLKTAYPLHDGDASYAGIPDNQMNDRQLLAKYWANFAVFKMMPLNLLEKYYGAEIAFYYAWLSFFDKALRILSIVGLTSIIMGLFALPEHATSYEICELGKNITLCPICHRLDYCPKYKLSAHCPTAKVVNRLDSMPTVLYAIFVCFWAVLFAKLWQRHENVLKIRWNIIFTPFNTKIRPEFVEKTKLRRVSEYTNEIEPYVPKIIAFWTTFVGVLAMIFWTIFIIFLTLFLAYMRSVIMVWLRKVKIWGMIHYKFLKVACLMAIVNVFCIKLLSLFNRKFLVCLTDFENPKTQADYDELILYKSFIFDIINYFVTLLYSSFFRGSWYHPLNRGIMEQIDVDVCHVAGCVLTLTIHVFVFLFAKIPLYRIFHLFYFLSVNKNRAESRQEMPQYEREYFLKPLGRFTLVFEQAELMIQYSILTIFTLALPLGPLIVWIINSLDTKLGAFRLVRLYRRPVPTPSCGVGQWNQILHAMTVISAIANPLVTAFVSELIPKLHHATHTEFAEGNSTGYIESKLSLLDLHDVASATGETFTGNVSICAYVGRNNPPGTLTSYQESLRSIVLLGIRLLVVIIFEHFVFALSLIIGHVIPTLPQSVKQTLESQHRNEERHRMERMRMAAQDPEFIESFNNSSDMAMNETGGSNVDDDNINKAHKRPRYSGTPGYSLSS